MPDRTTKHSPVISTGTVVNQDRMFQVVLFNDSHNTTDHVVRSLMKVFGHGRELASKIMHEAHARGRSIAEIEGREQAALHRGQLQSFGLTASVEEL